MSLVGIYLFLFCLLFLLPTNAQQVNCNTLGVQAQMVSCSPNFPSSRDGVIILQANSSYVCKLVITFNFTEQFPNAEYFNLAVGYSSLSLTQYGSYGNFWASSVYWDPTGREGSVNSSVTVVGNFSIFPNAIGTYYSGWSVTVYKSPSIYCNFGQHDGEWKDEVFAPVAVVLNDIQVGDITPPYVFTIKTEKEEYKKEDIIRTFAYITDRSLLLADDGWTSYSLNYSHSVSCPSARWQNISESERVKFDLPAIAILPPFGAPALTQGWFLTECPIPKDALPGRYNLTLLNIFDIYGNGVDTTGFWASTVVVNIV